MVDAIAALLQTYANRGVFRSFSRNGAEFRFRWLWNLPFRLKFNSERGAIVFPRLLPDIPPGSEMENSLKDFLRGCCSAERPAHRRIDPSRVSILYSNGRGSVTLKVVIRDGDYEYGTRQAIHLVNEIFLTFLSVHHPEYLAESFHLCLEQS